MAQNLTIDDIVDISVNISPVMSYRNTLNSALFLTESDKLSTENRVVEIRNLNELSLMGFLTNSPEYLAMSLYFAQSPDPSKGYLGFKASSETCVQALSACRLENFEWYVAILTDDMVEKTEISELKNVADFIEGASPESMFALNIDKTLVDSSKDQQIIDEIAKGNYQKTFIQWDNNESNAGKTAVAGIIGYALGYNKRVSSSFTLAYKTVAGLISNEITFTKLYELLNNNVNVYVRQGYYYNLFRQGTMSNGDRFDEVYYIDMLVNDLRNEIMNTLIGYPKIPQTEAGLNILTTSISQILDNYVDIQFIQPGVWLGTPVLNLTYGDTLSQGYLIVFDSLDNQVSSDRVDRIAPNCYICCKLAGAIEYVVLGISVSR